MPVIETQQNQEVPHAQAAGAGVVDALGARGLRALVLLAGSMGWQSLGAAIGRSVQPHME